MAEEKMMTMSDVEELEANPLSEEAVEAVKKALGILKGIKEKLSKRCQRAVDVLAGSAGYGYPEKEGSPKPEEYPKPLSEEVIEKVKEALSILKPFKEKFSKQVKHAIGTLAGAAGSGYPASEYPKEEVKGGAESESPFSLAEVEFANEVQHSVLVTIIKPGEFQTVAGKIRYSEEVLIKSVPLWEGAACFCDHFNKSVRNIVGVFYNPFYDDGVRASLRLTDDGLYKFIKQLIEDREAKLPIPDVGISADINVCLTESDSVKEVSQILGVISADVVFSPAAGGSFDRVLNSAGISLTQGPQNELESGSPEKGQSGEKVVPESRVRDLQSSNDKLRVELKEKDETCVNLQNTLMETIGKYREAMLKANPHIPAELIMGETAKEIEVAFSKAEAVVEKIKETLGSSPALRIPAGAPPRTGIDIEALSSIEKIKYGISKPNK